MEAASKWADARASLVSALAGLLARIDIPPLPAGLDALDVDAAAALKAEEASLVDLLTALRGLVEHCGGDLAPLLDTLRTSCERQNAKYYALRQEQQEVNETLKREDALKQQIGRFGHRPPPPLFRVANLSGWTMAKVANGGCWDSTPLRAGCDEGGSTVHAS